MNDETNSSGHDHMSWDLSPQRDDRQKVIDIWGQKKREGGETDGGEKQLYHKASHAVDLVINSPGPGSCSICSAAACSAGQYLSGCGGASPGSCAACPSGSYSASGVHASMRRW
jgi:hypothetical protein